MVFAIYAKKFCIFRAKLQWDDIFKSFELRHAPLLKRLKYDREKLAEELMKEIGDEEGRDKVNALTNIAIGKIVDMS